MNSEFLYRGDVHYIAAGPTTGSEQHSGRPAIIVSNDMNNRYSPTVEVVYLTASPKKELPTHVTLNSPPKKSIALCEQISTVDKSRVGDFVCRLTDEEFSGITDALMVSLGLESSSGGGTASERPPVNVPQPAIEDAPAYVRACAERDVYKELCATLLSGKAG